MKTPLEDESAAGVAAEAPAQPCPICGKATQPAGEKFGTFARRTFHFRHCPACFFTFVSDPWTDYAAIYDSRYYRGEGVDPYVDYYYELEHPEESVRRYEWDGIIAAVRSLCAVNPQTRWLDFGCGNGGQVRHIAARVGCEVGGTDTGEIIGAAREKGIRILNDEELTSWKGTCDVVTAIEVVEHLTDPLAMLRRIRALLKPGGLFLYTTGNARPFRDRITTWSYALPEIHVSFFEPESMVQALRATGFRPEFRSDLPGWEQIIRFKLCKRLGFRRCSPLHHLIPWKILVPVFQRKLEIGGLPIAWAE